MTSHLVIGYRGKSREVLARYASSRISGASELRITPLADGSYVGVGPTVPRLDGSLDSTLLGAKGTECWASEARRAGLLLSDAYCATAARRAMLR